MRKSKRNRQIIYYGFIYMSMEKSEDFDINPFE